MTKEFVAWLKQFDSLPSRKDSKADLVWKAAQRELYERAKAIYEAQTEGRMTKKEKKAASLGFHLRPRDD